MLRTGATRTSARSGAPAHRYALRNKGLRSPGIPTTTGFVLIITSPGKERGVYRQLQSIEEITEVHLLFGDYDLIAKVVVEGYNAVSRVVVEKIRPTSGVLDTITMTEVPF
jgi:DNA-binding Lrp family transcriptional regulator